MDMLIKNEAGEIVGGLIASTYWGWLEVNVLWIAEGLRRLGHGRTLLRTAEAEARTRGCAHVMLTTYSFQAAWVLREGRVSRCGRDGRLSAGSGVLLDEEGFFRQHRVSAAVVIVSDRGLMMPKPDCSYALPLVK